MQSNNWHQFAFAVTHLLIVLEHADAEVVPHEVPVVVVPPVLVARHVRARRHVHRLTHELHPVVLVQAELVRRVVDLARANLRVG